MCAKPDGNDWHSEELTRIRSIDRLLGRARGEGSLPDVLRQESSMKTSDSSRALEFEPLRERTFPSSSRAGEDGRYRGIVEAFPVDDG